MMFLEMKSISLLMKSGDFLLMINIVDEEWRLQHLLMKSGGSTLLWRFNINIVDEEWRLDFKFAIDIMEKLNELNVKL